MGGYRPDVGSMLKQPQATAPQEPTPNATQAPSQTIEEVKSKEATVKPGPTPGAERPLREQERRVEPSEAKERRASGSRSRSREKSPLRRTKDEEEKKEKEKEKEISKEEKLRLMKERYAQRKANQAAGPAAPQTSE